ncbi:MAG: hypothetical protein QOI40_2194 [Alphaproteobacteria bacterium]|nr:hypothetical protein [Alphaproteobacteria bacterium]
MSSTPDPILLLEPANLLEPLDLRDRVIDPANWSARPEQDGSSPKRVTRTNRSKSTPPIGRDSRWPVRSALVVAGALACFGAGAAMPQLPNLLFGESEHSQTDGSATRPSAPPAAAPVKQAAAPVKSVDSKPAEPERNDPASNGASQKAALGADAGVSAMVNAPESDTSSIPVAKSEASSPVAKSEAAGAATSCNPAKPSDDANCLAGGVPAAAKGPAAAPNRNSDRSPTSAPAVAITTVPIPPAKPTSPAPATPDPRSAAPQRAETQANGHEEERAQSAAPRSTRQTQRDRATQRDAADQQPAADDAQTSTSSDRRQDVSRAPSRRRAARDTIPAASLWGRRQDPDSDRASIWRRDRNDDDGNDDHRVVGRVPREDDRTTGRAPRFGGPLSIFPFPNDW